MYVCMYLCVYVCMYVSKILYLQYVFMVLSTLYLYIYMSITEIGFIVQNLAIPKV